QYPHQGGLAGPVGAQHPDHAAGRHLQVHPGQRVHVAAPISKILGQDCRLLAHLCLLGSGGGSGQDCIGCDRPGLTARMIAEPMPSASWGVGLISIPVNPAAASPSRYSPIDSTPAMQPTWSPGPAQQDVLVPVAMAMAAAASWVRTCLRIRVPGCWSAMAVCSFVADGRRWLGSDVGAGVGAGGEGGDQGGQVVGGALPY